MKTPFFVWVVVVFILELKPHLKWYWQFLFVLFRWSRCFCRFRSSNTLIQSKRQELLLFLTP